MMDLQTLKYFQYVAKYKNITRAAKKFYISQSTLSRHIMSLEKELGVELFRRSNKQIHLTKAGKVLEKECDLFIKHMETIIDNVQIADKGNEGAFRITAPGILCDVLADAIFTVKKKYPKIKFIFEAYDFDEISASIQYDVYDLGFTYDFSAGDTEGLERIEIGSDSFSLAVSSKLFDNPTIDSIPEIVRKLPLILPSYTEPPFMKIIIHELKTFADLKLLETTYVNTTESAMLEVSLGLGYSIVPTSLTKSKNALSNIAYINLDKFSAKGTIIMLFKKSYSSEILKEFVKIIQDLSPTIKTDTNLK